MNNFDQFDSGKQNKKTHRKSSRKFLDEEQRDEFKMNKSFKHRKKELLEDDDDWENWEEEYNQ